MSNLWPRLRLGLLLVLGVALAASQASTQGTSPITTPVQQFGAAIGDDYFLATYRQLEDYWQRLDRESDRLALQDIGRTAEGRTQWMAVISDPDNLARLDRLKAIARQLALADGLDDAAARALASEGRSVVLIAGGIHADEVLGSQQLIETVYQLVSRNDDETRRFLRDVVVLVVDANPDGHDLVADWYMRQRPASSRTLAGVPRLYQKYAGHDNNRDFYMSTQPETINLNRVLYDEWFPQVIYDHHQTGPAGTVMFAPPFRGPFNYVFDPLVPLSVDLLGAAMQTRFAAEGKAGVTMRSGSTYSTWWNGGLRTTVYFHNQIGLLTETIGSPTPTRIPYVAEAQLPSADLPFPIAPQAWHFRQSIDYSLTANRAVIDAASRNRETLLFNAYRMGRNAIERGSRDSWTPSPHRRVQPGDLAARDARGYVIPADQPDFPTATKFVNALIRTGVRVERATGPFRIGDARYPAGSFVVRTAQAFRPHVLDMFEPQDHPDDFQYPGGPPTPPYDSAGWTLAFQMGVRFDRLLDAFQGPFEPVRGLAAVPAGEVRDAEAAVGYLLSHRENDAAVAVNRLLAAGAAVYWTRDDGIYVPAEPRVLPILRAVAAERGVTVRGVATAPAGGVIRIRPVRIGLWDRYGGSPESGWVRFVLEQFEFPYELVYPQALDAGNLASRFDVLVFPDGAIPGRDSADRYSDGAPALALIPPADRARTGIITLSRTIPQLRAFAEAGGTLLAIGHSTAVGAHLGLPIGNALAVNRGGRVEPLPPEQFYVPGSILRVSVDTSQPVAWGLDSQVDVFFDNRPVHALDPGADRRGIRAIASFTDPTPLRSGWAWGQGYLAGGAAVVEAPLGAGRVLLFGPEIVFRGQPHGTFKFLFNGIHLARAQQLPAVSPAP